MTGALQRFRVMSVIAGVALFVLLAAMVLKYGYDREAFAEAYSPVHGFLYVLYLVATADLSRRAGWSLLRTVLVALAGTVPLLSFVAERRVTRDVLAAG